MDQLETLIYGFAMLIAYQCMTCLTILPAFNFRKFTFAYGKGRVLSGDSIASHHSGDSQHGDGLGRTVTQFLRPR